MLRRRASLWFLLGVVILVAVTSGSTLIAKAFTGQSGLSLNWSAGDPPIPTATATAVASVPMVKKVKPLIQADPNAGYDSPQQYRQYWDSACSAAAMDEMLSALGVRVTIGEILDHMIALHMITPADGLVTQDAWSVIPGQYHLQGRVSWTRDYQSLLQIVNQQQLAVVIGVRDSSGRYYPAFTHGHYLVVVGGDKNGVDIVDSSLYRIRYLQINVFDDLWTRESVTITRSA